MYLTKKIRKKILKSKSNNLNYIVGHCYVIKLLLIEACRTQEDVPKVEIMVFNLVKVIIASRSHLGNLIKFNFQFLNLKCSQ